jgi:nanoRNase/pAp phosphatase (c-di-AMP/oligoRNAs hydrolase)
LFFDHDNEVYVVIVYRIEGTKFRFTIVTKGEIDAREIAVQYGGGGAKNMAGFATDLVSGATVLDYILRQNE